MKKIQLYQTLLVCSVLTSNPSYVFSAEKCDESNSAEISQLKNLNERIKKILPPITIENQKDPGVFVDILHASYVMHVDLDHKKVRVTATLEFRTNDTGYPLIDLVLPTSKTKIDSHKSALLETNLPGEQSKMKYVDRVLKPGKHKVVIEYEYDYPLVYGKDNKIEKDDLNINQDELFFGLSDLNDRGYLERYLPTNLEFDDYPYDVKIKFNKNKKEMFVVSNGDLKKNGRKKVKLKFNEISNSSSIFLDIAPKDSYTSNSFNYTSISKKEIPVQLFIANKYAGTDKDNKPAVKELDQALPEKFKKEVLSSLQRCEELFGAWPGDKIIIKGKNSGTGGMEYAMGTEAALPAIQHELLHSYFGRGIKNTDGNTGWLDEATVVWLEEYIKGESKNISHNDKNERLVELGAPLYLTGTILGGRSIYRRNSENKAYTYGGNFMSYLDHVISQNNPEQGLIDVLKKLVQSKMHQSWDNKIFLESIKEVTGLDLRDEFDFYIEGKPLHEVNYKKIMDRNADFETSHPHLNQNVKMTNPEGKTSPLLLAASGNSIEAFDYFYKQDPDSLFQKDRYGRSALSYALVNGNIEIIKRLKELGFKNEDGPNGDAKKFLSHKKNNFFDQKIKDQIISVLNEK